MRVEQIGDYIIEGERFAGWRVRQQGEPVAFGRWTPDRVSALALVEELRQRLGPEIDRKED